MKLIKILILFCLSFFFTTNLVASLVATTKGNLSINQGNMNYSLPLILPKGVTSFKPNLSIYYNSSNNVNGKLGLGFKLNGFSSISKCNEYKQEDIKDLSRDYNYCLNGEKLLLVNPSDTYGGNNVEYKTQINNYKKIVSFSSSFTTSWKVYTSDGTVHEYGFSSNTQIKNPNNETVIFKRNKIKDIHGNEIVYVYDENAYLSTIAYGNNSIDFSYKDVSKKRFTYYKGVKTLYDKILEKISIKIKQNEVSNYQLTYEESNHQNKLIQIKQCFESQCLDPLNFKWTQESVSDDFEETSFTSAKDFGSVSQALYGSISGDFNKDGLSDILRYKNKEIYTLFAKNNNTFEQKLFTSTQDYGKNEENYMLLSGDYNGDGLSDIIRFSHNKVFTLLSFGDGNFSETQNTLSKDFGKTNSSYYASSGDYNGDGLDDFLRYNANEMHVFLSLGNGKFSYKKSTTPKNFGSKLDSFFIASGDYNGDGLGDILRYTNNTLYTLLSLGDGTFEQISSTSSTNFGSKNDDYYSLSGDYNGDGLSDFVRYTSNKIYVLFSKGDGKFEEKLFTTSKNYGKNTDTYSTLSSDFNNDGLSDIIRYTNKELHVLYSNGNGSFAEQHLITNSNYGAKDDVYESMGGEFSGDGIKDFIRYKNNKIYTLKSKKVKNIITNISNNADQDIEVVYSNMHDNQIYTSSESSLYPNNVIKSSSKSLVKSFKVLDGIGEYKHFSYSYEDLKYNHEEGSLGFKKITSTNESNGNQSLKTYYQNLPFIAILKQKIKRVNNIRILEENNEYEEQNYTSMNPKIKGIYLKRKTINKYDLKGDFLLKVKEEHTEPDVYGNITEYVISTYDGSELNSSLVFSKSITKTFKSPALNSYLVSLVSKIQNSSKKASSQDSINNEVLYTYTQKGQVKTQSINNENNSLVKKYDYDSFSNIIKQTISGSNIEERKEEYVYDSTGINLIQITNALNQRTTHTYDDKYNVLSSTSFNNLSTFWTYDALNRKTKETRADGTSTTWSYSWDKSFQHSLYKISIKNTGAPEVITYFDLKDRKIRVQRRGFKGNKIYEDTFYDKLGRVSIKSTPYYEEELPSYSYYTYDALNRLIEIKSTGPNNEEIKKNYTYDGFTTTFNNAKNQTKSTRLNALGQVVQIIDNTKSVNENNTSQITYAYDALGNLILTTDSKNNNIIIKYDRFSNKIYMNDPDLGVWTYTYNLLGELLSQKDAKNQVTYMSYDLLGRLIKKVQDQEISTFIYDVSANAKGKIAIEKKENNNILSYKKEYFYDALSRVKEIKEYINNKVFETSYVYDEEGKLKTTINPNGFISTNEYNTQGYLSAIKSPIKSDLSLDTDVLKHKIKEHLENKNKAFNALIELNTQVELYRVKALEFLDLAKRYKNVNVSIETQLLRTVNLLIKTSIDLNKEAKEYEQSYQSASKKLNFYLIKLINFNDEQLFKWLMDTFSLESQDLLNKALEKLNEAKNTLEAISTQEELATYKEITGYYINETKVIIQEAKSNLQIARNYKEKYKNLREGVDKAYQGMFDDSLHKYYYKILEADEFGRITKSYQGNGLVTTKDYNNKNGHLNSIQTGYHGSSDVRDIKYTYDVLNNVTSKNDLKQNIFQDYSFDTLNRVTSVRTRKESLSSSTSDSVNYEYDSLGNITFKSDISNENFVYQKAHQLKSTGNITYNYDANGNVIQKNKNGKKITLEYNASNKPILIQDESNKTQFFYAPNQSRYKKVLNENTTFYIGKHYELENVQGAVLQKNYIYAGNDLVAIHIQEDDGNMILPQNRYLHKDALGSIDTITNESGVVIQRLAYGAFGKQLVQTWINEKDENKSLVKRGYTGHEHISEFEFIHMNGRVYDVDTARFLSADPNIFHPFNPLDFNRYSYVWNNPLRYTDPSGFGLASSEGTGNPSDTGGYGGGYGSGGQDEYNSDSDHNEANNINKRQAEREAAEKAAAVAAALAKQKAKEKAEKEAEQIRKQAISDAEMMMNQFKNLDLPDLPDIPMDDRMALAPAIGLYWGYNAVVAAMAAFAAKKAIDSLGAQSADFMMSSKQDKMLSKNEAKRLAKGGSHPHDLKENSRQDLYKDKDGNISVKRKGGIGPGEPTGLNINDF